MRLRWSEHARQDLLGIFEFVARDRPLTARRLVQRIREGMNVVREHPLIERVVPELEISNVRERVVPPYRVIYQVRREEVVVLTVVHDRRDLEPQGEEE